MIVLEKTYQKEPIPGLRKSVDRAMTRRLSSDHKSKVIYSEYESMTAEEVYDLCPFSTLLDTYPGPSDWTALGTFGRELDRHIQNRKEMSEWANNIISHIRGKLWPKSSPVSGLLNSSTPE